MSSKSLIERIYENDAFIDAAVKYKFENGALINVVKAAIAVMGDSSARKDEGCAG